MTKALQYSLSILLVFSFNSYKADLPYMPVSFILSADKKVYQAGELIQFKLTITNNDKFKAYPIVLPGSQNSGKKLLWFQAYSVNKQFYTCVAKENPDIKMKCTKPGDVTVRNLRPGQSLEIVLFLNDKKNYLTQTSSHHALEPELKEGKYEVLIFYDPSTSSLKDLYYYFGSTNDSNSTEQLNFWYGGNPSNYVSIEIVSKKQKSGKSGSAFGPDYFDFCKTAGNKNRNSSSKFPEVKTAKSPEFSEHTSQREWLKVHRSFVWPALLPESVLCSLPAYFEREVVFDTVFDPLHSNDVCFQLGFLETARSKGKDPICPYWTRYNSPRRENPDNVEPKNSWEMDCS